MSQPYVIKYLHYQKIILKYISDSWKAIATTFRANSRFLSPPLHWFSHRRYLPGTIFKRNNQDKQTLPTTQEIPLKFQVKDKPTKIDHQN